MHAQLIRTHRQFKVQYSTYATRGLSFCRSSGSVNFCQHKPKNERWQWKKATVILCIAELFPINEYYIIYSVSQSPHISHTHPMQHAKHEGERQSCGENSVLESMLEFEGNVYHRVGRLYM